jgi:hypothetical protein
MIAERLYLFWLLANLDKRRQIEHGRRRSEIAVPNTMQRMGASGSGQLQFVCLRRLARTADAHRWTAGA